MADEPSRPIIIKKKKGSHGGHHGGAWKVAYADFVTAMMALFIVLWLLSSSEKVKQAVAGYFQDPAGYGKETGSGVSGTGSGVSVGKEDMNQLKEKLEQAIKEMPAFDAIKDNVALTVTGDGLRVELLESEKGMFFESGKAQPSTEGAEMIGLLAKHLGALPNRLLIEGHTDAKPFSNGGGYTNWELSADRANSARRLMESSGLRAGQVAQVRGFADQQLRNTQDPTDASNRRVSVIVQYLNPPHEASGPSGKRGEAKGHGGTGQQGSAGEHGKPPAKEAATAHNKAAEKPASAGHTGGTPDATTKHAPAKHN